MYGYSEYDDPAYARGLSQKYVDYSEPPPLNSMIQWRLLGFTYAVCREL